MIRKELFRVLIAINLITVTGAQSVYVMAQNGTNVVEELMVEEVEVVEVVNEAEELLMVVEDDGSLVADLVADEDEIIEEVIGEDEEVVKEEPEEKEVNHNEAGKSDEVEDVKTGEEAVGDEFIAGIEAEKLVKGEAEIAKEVAAGEVVDDNEIVAEDETIVADKTITVDEVIAVDKTIAVDEVIVVDETIAVDEVIVVDETIVVDEMSAADEETSGNLVVAEDEVAGIIEVIEVQKIISNDEAVELNKGTTGDGELNETNDYGLGEAVVVAKPIEISVAQVSQISANQGPMAMQVKVTGDFAKEELELVILDQEGREVGRYQEHTGEDGILYGFSEISQDGVYTMYIKSKSLDGQESISKYVFTINQEGTSFWHDMEKGNKHLEEAFAPRIKMENIDAITVLSCMVNGEEIPYSLEQSELCIAPESLKAGKNRITLEVRDAAGNISAMQPWEFYVPREQAADTEIPETKELKRGNFWVRMIRTAAATIWQSSI